MGSVIGEYLPLAVALAVIPIPIIAVILLLFTDHARVNGLAFLAGWVVAVALTMTVLVMVASTKDVGGTDDPTSFGAGVTLALGLLLVGLAFKQWRKRPTPGEVAEMPRWMARIDAMQPLGAAGLAVALAVLNPKNLLLIAGAAVIVAQADLTPADQVLAVAIFTLIGSISIATPTLAYAFFGTRVQPSLDRSKDWPTAHSAAMMAIILLLIGVVLLGKGIKGLS